MGAPLLSDLREPPVVGRFYMVPTVHYLFRGVVREWPVLGPIHDDAQDLNFPHLHYHFDGRFMAPSILGHVSYHGDYRLSLNGVVLVEPIDIATDGYMQSRYGRLPKRPTLKRRKCFRADQPFTDEAKRRIIKRVGSDTIAARHGEIAEPIRLSDGRLLCPHRKVDLSQFTPDENGLVSCPLHGLRVRCGVSA